MNKNINIRPVRPEDAEKHIRLGNLVWRDAYKDIFPEEVFIQKESRLQDMMKTFSQFVYNGGDRIGYVAEVDGELVGFISGKLSANYEHFKKQNYAELMAIYILPEYQGKGLGSTFKNLFLDWARKNNVKKFVIGVLKDNHKARKVYEKWGGQLDKYTQPFVRLGVEYDEVFYTYDLSKQEH